MFENNLPTLDKLAPDDAWKPWQPDAQNPWNLKWAAHLYRRAAFGVPAYVPEQSSWSALQKAVQQGPDACLDELLKGGPGQESFASMMDELGPRLGRIRRFEFEADLGQGEIQGWWMYRMVYTPHPLQEKLTLFWHNHFATSVAKVQRSSLMIRQNQTLRQHALGKFQPLVMAMSRDPAMLIWLDGNSNVKSHPNENYGRELMELFTLGVGNYSEKDIREVARAFTGWHTVGQEFHFNPGQHDDGKKTVFGREGNLDGGDIVRMLLEQPACARFLVRKLYRHFISENEVPPDSLLDPLAEELRRTDYDIRAVVRRMLRSRLFFSQHAFRQRIKSPVEFVVGLIRSVDGRPMPGQLAATLENMGQKLFGPPNVKGWDGGKAWLNTATVLARHNLACDVVGMSRPGVPAPPASTESAVPVGGPVESAPVSPMHIDVLGLVKKHSGKTPEEQVAWCLDLFLQGLVEPAAKKKLVEYVKKTAAKDKELDRRLQEMVHTVLLMPEYQLA